MGSEPRHVDGSPWRVAGFYLRLCVDASSLDHQQDGIRRWSRTMIMCLHSAGVGVVSGQDEETEAQVS